MAPAAVAPAQEPGPGKVAWVREWLLGPRKAGDPGLGPSWLYSPAFVPSALLALTLAMFAGVLFLPGNLVASDARSDLSSFFVYWRDFGFSELRRGHIALWNPHVFSGTPFVGDFQSSLFYPLNLIYLVLPLAKAINYEIALHVFLVGLFMAFWLGRYRLHPLAVLLGSSLVMFGRPFFRSVFDGHLAPLDSMAWVPLILLTLDSLLDEPGFEWVLVGTFALAMQILAGYPQVLFNTLFACALYGSLRLVTATHPLKTVLAVCVVGVGALLIGTVQLWTGLQTAAEGTRQGGIPLAVASFLSLQTGNLLTHVFFGVTGLAMAVRGMGVKSAHRGAWIATAVLLLMIALGYRTPLFRLLYDFVPGFDRFRRPLSFSFEFLVFVAMLSAVGMDNALRSARGSKIAAAALLIIALVLGASGAGSSPGAGATLTRVYCLISAGICLFLAALFLWRCSLPWCGLHPGGFRHCRGFYLCPLGRTYLLSGCNGSRRGAPVSGCAPGRLPNPGLAHSQLSDCHRGE